MNNTKTTLISILTGVAMILIAIVVAKNNAYAATYIPDPNENCPHTNTIVAYDKCQEADCFHTLEKSGRIICEDCGQVQFFVEVGSDYQHGPLEFIDESTEPTCVSNGWCKWYYRCSLCGAKVSGGIVPKQKVQHPVFSDTDTPVCYESKKELNANMTVTEGIWCSACNCWVTKETRDLTENEMNEFQTQVVSYEEQLPETFAGYNSLLKMISRIRLFFETLARELSGVYGVN